MRFRAAEKVREKNFKKLSKKRLTNVELRNIIIATKLGGIAK